MPTALPKRLGKPPLIDAVFELRFPQTGIPLSSILPGLIYNQYQASIQKTPFSHIPEEMRKNDPNMQFQPLVIMESETFRLGISDRSLSISPKNINAGWSLFIQEIIKILGIINDIGVIREIDRFSMRFTNMLPIELIDVNAAPITLAISLANTNFLGKYFHLTLENRDCGNRLIQNIQLATNAKATMITSDHTIKELTGFLLVIDTIKNADPHSDWKSFFDNAENLLTEVHTHAKESFFKCLTESGLKELEPEYD